MALAASEPGDRAPPFCALEPRAILGPAGPSVSRTQGRPGMALQIHTRDPQERHSDAQVPTLVSSLEHREGPRQAPAWSGMEGSLRSSPPGPDPSEGPRGSPRSWAVSDSRVSPVRHLPGRCPEAPVAPASGRAILSFLAPNSSLAELVTRCQEGPRAPKSGPELCAGRSARTRPGDGPCPLPRPPA